MVDFQRKSTLVQLPQDQVGNSRVQRQFNPLDFGVFPVLLADHVPQRGTVMISVNDPDDIDVVFRLFQPAVDIGLGLEFIHLVDIEFDNSVLHRLSPLYHYTKKSVKLYFFIENFRLIPFG
jgi:hypothetical protein